MSWAKFDDGLDEELCDLTHEAFRLYVSAITYSRRRNLGGLLSAAVTLHICRSQRISVKAIDELIGTGRWLSAPDNHLEIKGYAEYNPLTSTERVRLHRQRTRNADETPMERGETVSERIGNASTRTRPRDGSPVPVPVPVPSIEVPSGTSHLSDEPKGIPQRVFEAWRGANHHPSARLTPQRVKLVKARLRDGYGEERLTNAVLGLSVDPWPDRALHNDMAYALKSGAAVEKFEAIWLTPPPPQPRAENPIDKRIREFGRSLAVTA